MNKVPYSKADIEKAAKDFDQYRWRLRFSSAIEKCFQVHHFKQHSAQIQVMILLGLGVVLLFRILDIFLFSHPFMTVWKLWVFSVFPYIIGAYYVVSDRFHMNRQVKLMIFSCLLSASAMVLMLLDRQEFQLIYANSILLIPMFVFVLLGLQFKYAVISSVLMMVFSNVALYSLDSVAFTTLLIQNVIYISGFTVVLTTNYFQERSMRFAYLQTLLLDNEKDNLKKANERLRSLVSIDSLTGIYNRRSFDEMSEREWKRCLRKHYYFTLLMIDVDNFKKYNDHYGHQAGDVCLYQIAQCLDQLTRRSTDLVARYGGEEFAIILSDMESQAALKQAEKIRQGIYDLNILHSEAAVDNRVTISIGVATDQPTVEGSLKKLITRADIALYQAKERGRNKVVVFEAE